MSAEEDVITRSRIHYCKTSWILHWPMHMGLSGREWLKTAGYCMSTTYLTIFINNV